LDEATLMPLQKIIDKILQEARAEAEGILDAARAEAKAIETAGKAEAEKQKAQKIANAADSLKSEKLKNLALLNLEMRKSILKTRRDMMDEVFDKSVQELEQLRAESQRKLIQKIVGNFIPTETCEIIVAADEIDKFTLLLSSLWGVVFTKFCKVTPSKKSIGGGFIIRTRGLELDCTYERLINEQRQQLEFDVAQILFPENASNKK